MVGDIDHRLPVLESCTYTPTGLSLFLDANVFVCVLSISTNSMQTVMVPVSPCLPWGGHQSMSLCLSVMLSQCLVLIISALGCDVLCPTPLG